MKSGQTRCTVERLESRQLFSGSTTYPLREHFDGVDSPVMAIAISPAAQKRFEGQVGSWEVADGLPAMNSGIVAIGIINWGDGKSSRAELVDDGTGIVQIAGRHVWRREGVFQLSVKIQEFPKAHPTQITEIGQAEMSITVLPKPHVIRIAGTFTGTYTIPFGNPDAPRQYLVTSTGTAGALGSVDVSGRVAPPGFIRGSKGRGEITLTNANGSVTIDISGNLRAGDGPLPRRLSYTITDATGIYVSAAGTGKVALLLDTDTQTFLMVIR